MMGMHGLHDFMWAIREPVEPGLRLRVEYVAPDDWHKWGTVVAVQPGFWDWEQDNVPLTVRLDDGRLIETDTDGFTGVRYQHHPTKANVEAKDWIFRLMLVPVRDHEPVGTPVYWYDEDGLQECRIVGRHLEKQDIIKAFDHWYYVIDFYIETGRHAGNYCADDTHNVLRIIPRFRKLDTRRKLVGVW